MRILLIQPPPRKIEYENIVVPPLGIAYLAAVLEKRGYVVSILDAFALQQSWSDFETSVKNAGADIIGITGMTPVIDSTYRASKICRKYCKYIIVGGPHVTVFKQDIFKQIPEADFAVYGEGEETFSELVDSLRDNISNTDIRGIITKNAINPPRDLIENLDALLFPARHLLPNDRYRYIFSKKRSTTTIFTSRGCPYSCIFCDKSVFGSKYRPRSVDNVLSEIDEITDHFKDVSIIFYDDLFTLNKERVISVCRGILDRGLKIDWKCEGRVDRVDSEMLFWMKKAGCSMIAYGVESGNQAGLDYLKKNITLEQVKKAFYLTKKSGIRTMGYFILGIPVETYKDELGTIEFAARLRADYAQFSILSPFPGTEMYGDAVKNGSYKEIDANNPMDKDLKRPVILSSNWNEQKLKEIIRTAHEKFYLRPAYIIKSLLSIHNLTDMKRFFKAGIRIFAWSAKRGSKSAR